MFDSAPSGRLRRFRREDPEETQRTLGADDPAIQESLLPEPVIADLGVAADPFATGTSIEFRSDTHDEAPTPSSLGRMWESYAAKAFVVATGSVVRPFPWELPEGIPLLTSDDMFLLEDTLRNLPG